MAVWYVRVLLFAAVSSVPPSFATVSLVQDNVKGSVCPGDPVITFTCTVSDGTLRWRNSGGTSLATYFGSSIPGATLSAGGFNFNLTLLSGSNLISTATIRPETPESTITLQCSNSGGVTNTSTVTVRPLAGPSRLDPLCTTTLSWTGPTNRNCCTSYQIMLSSTDFTSRFCNTTTTSVSFSDCPDFSSLPRDVSYNTTVTCLSDTGFKGISSEAITIANNASYSAEMIRESSCENATVSYRVSWSPSVPDDTTCTPYLPMANINCYFGRSINLLSSTNGTSRNTFCRYNKAQAAQGNLFVTITGRDTFNEMISITSRSIDGDECKRINDLTEDRMDLMQQNSEQKTITIGVGFGYGFTALLSIVFIAMLAMAIVASCRSNKQLRQQLQQQQLGTNELGTNETSEKL